MMKQRNKFGSDVAMKISYNEAAYILDWKQNHKFTKYLGVWKIIKSEYGGFHIKCDVRWWFYILAYIPVNIINLFCYMWDGGISEYELWKRNCVHYVFDKYSIPAQKANEICNKHIDKNNSQ